MGLGEEPQVSYTKALKYAWEEDERRRRRARPWHRRFRDNWYWGYTQGGGRLGWLFPWHERLRYTLWGYRPEPVRERTFVAYWYFNGWSHIQLGVHVCLWSPNIEVHLPFGFFRVGWQRVYPRHPL